ncbi:outer membrane beta-barrel protein [Zhongshania sp.]|uniref:outer membrane beta-barrel protein n=1 Tax=Zhongshania sp. TaxID=1971902 RepID=UPI0035622E81
MNKKMGLASVVLAAAMPLASMAESGTMYVTGQFGKTSYDIDGGSNIDDEDNGYTMGIGVRMGPNVSIEGGYVDLGEVSGGNGVDSLSVETSGAFAGLGLFIPLQPGFELTGRAGLIAWDSDAKMRIGGVSSSESEDGTDIYFGIGAAFQVSRELHLTVGFDRYDIDDTDVDMLSLGAKFYFAL